MAPERLQPKRSFTGRPLLPAARNGTRYEALLERRASSYTFIGWTFGRGSVLWRIWPAVLLHTLFAAAVVSLSLTTNFKLNIPSVMLTVLGVVIGFVIAYRVGSGYDRFWMGRVCWSELTRNARTMGRLIWFHVPPLVTPKTAQEIASGKAERNTEELLKVMAEKRMALELIEAFAVSTKHHLRGELGIYYEDLYHLVRSLRDREHGHRNKKRHHAPQATPAAPQTSLVATSSADAISDAVDMSADTYGTFNDNTSTPSLGLNSHKAHLRLRRTQSDISAHSSQSEQQHLLPAAQPTSQTLLSRISADLIPFAGLLQALRRDFWDKLMGSRQLEILPPNIIAETDEEWGIGQPQRPVMEKRALKHGKGHPRVAGDGQNLPLVILQGLSDWCSVLEDRNTVPGNSMAGLLTCIALMEDNLTAMERILTTPLPFVYSVHIRHTVWLYLFFLPFQLVDQFGWHSIPGVATAAFIYLGFLAAGEEIEQPFGYEDNDLDLDLFCHEIIQADMEHFKSVKCFNAYFNPHDEHHRHTHEVGNHTAVAQDGSNVFGMI